MKKKKIEWWQPEYGFFGRFYHFGDHSRNGFDINESISRKNRTKREVDYVLKFLNPQRGESILDCPCGSGRHSILLSELGFDVLGVDINQQMIDYALENNNNNLQLESMDMRRLNFEKNSFNYLINMFISFGFFKDDADNIKVASEFYRVLKPKGKLFIHLDLNYDNVINGNFSSMERIHRYCDFNGVTKELFIEENYNPKSKSLVGKWQLINGNYDSKEYSLRIYDNDKEFIPIFQNVGFSKVILLDPKTGKYPNENSTETILIATK